MIKAIDEQGKLTPALREAIALAETKQALEDLYLPFKQKRRTKGMMAREAGLEPLADRLWADPTLDPMQEAAAFVQPPEVLEVGASEFARLSAESAVRAVRRCAPYNLPPEKYDSWREILMTFDPREILGG